MNILETTALKWHLRSDHARDGAKFGSPTCNCMSVAKRIVPMLAEVFDAGFDYADGQHRALNSLLGQANMPIMLINPYRKTAHE